MARLGLIWLQKKRPRVPHSSRTLKESVITDSPPTGNVPVPHHATVRLKSSGNHSYGCFLPASSHHRSMFGHDFPNNPAHLPAPHKYVHDDRTRNGTLLHQAAKGDR